MLTKFENWIKSVRTGIFKTISSIFHLLGFQWNKKLIKKPIAANANGIANQFFFKKIPISIKTLVIQGNCIPIESNISLNTGNTNTNMTITINTANKITKTGYIKVPITLDLIAACLFNNSNKRSNVFSNSPESSPAYTKPI